MKKRVLLFLPVLVFSFLVLFSVLPVYADTAPAQVASTGGASNLATIVSAQRKTFYAAGRFWVFGSDGTNILFWSSTDGSSWSSSTKYAEGDRGYQFSLYWDGTYVHTISSNSSQPMGLYYMRGTPNSDGTITWGTQRTVLSPLANCSRLLGSVAVDTNGYPWIGFGNSSGGDCTPWAVQATATDGSTWGTPVQLTASVGRLMVSILPLSSGNMYCVWCYYTPAEGSRTLEGKYYDGSAWTSLATIESNVKSYQQWSALSNDTTVYLTYTNGTSNDVMYRTYTNSSGWSGYTTLCSVGVEAATSPTISMDQKRQLHVMWSNYTTVCRDNYTTSWQGVEQWQICGSNIGISTLTSTYNSMQISCVWQLDTAIWHASFSTDSAPTLSAVSGTNWVDTNNCYARCKTYTATITYSDGDGYADIRYCELFVKTGGNTTRAEFAFLEDTNTFSTASGSSAWYLSPDFSTYSKSGNDVTLTWKFDPHWAAAEESGLNFLLFVNDTLGFWASSTSQSFDVVTRLVTSPSANKPRTNLGGSVTVSGTVYYGNNPGSNTASSSYPGNADFTSISIHDANHNVVGSTASIINGAYGVTFNIPSAVQSNTYHVYIDMSDADYTDGDAVNGATTSVIGDRLQVQSYTVSNARAGINVNVNIDALVWFDYDNTVCTTATITLNGYSAVHQGSGVYRITKTSATVTSVTYNSVACSAESAYGVTTVDQNGKSGTVIWDAIEVFQKDDPLVSTLGSLVSASGFCMYEEQSFVPYVDVRVTNNRDHKVTVGWVDVAFENVTYQDSSFEGMIDATGRMDMNRNLASGEHCTTEAKLKALFSKEVSTIGLEVRVEIEGKEVLESFLIETPQRAQTTQSTPEPQTKPSVDYSPRSFIPFAVFCGVMAATVLVLRPKRRKHMKDNKNQRKTYQMMPQSFRSELLQLFR